MAGAAKVSATVSVLSALSAWSLLAFGGLSLLVLCFSWSWAGGLIAFALIAHGVIELRLRGRFMQNGERRTGVFLAWNQLALSGSVILYLLWQVVSFDQAELDAILARDPLRSLLQQAPPEATELLYRDFPKLLAGAYGLAGIVVLVGCLGMALMYVKAGKSPP